MIRRTLMALLALLLCSCAQAPELTVMRVAASNENQYPYLFWDENGECAGLEADIAKALAEALDVPAEFTPYARDDIPAVLEGGEADIGFGCFTHSDRLPVTSVYYAKRPFVLTRRGEYYPFEEAMADLTVLSDVDMETAVTRLLAGTADAVICDEFAAVGAVEQSGEVLQAQVMQSEAETELVGLLAKAYPELLEAMEKLLSTGKIAELAAKYL